MAWNVGPSVNFLHLFDRQTPKPTPWAAYILGAVALLFLAVIFVGSIAIHAGLEAFTSAQAAKAALTLGVARLESRSFDDAAASIFEGRADIEQAQEHLRTLEPLKIIPLVRRQLRATEDILSTVHRLSGALLDGSTLVENIVSTAFGEHDVALAEISKEQRRNFLRELLHAGPMLRGIAADVDLAALSLGGAPRTLLLPQIRDVLVPLERDLANIQQSLHVAIPLLEALPLVAGYPKPQTYLFLFQNNDELRPTGGFIGTYGRLVLRDGDIASLDTDNIYRIDRLAEVRGLRIPPPAPIAALLNTSWWFLRDVNWSPDFPSTAERALWFYAQESGDRRPIDGVIAITPTVLERLLAVVGPIEVGGVQFTAETVVDQLQYSVEKGYAEAGLPEVERKSIIGDLARAILEKTFSTPVRDLPALLSVFESAIREKHILIYQTDAALQELIEREGWGGAVEQTESDFLMVVDANLRALKTDRVMNRAIHYTVHPEGARLRAAVTVNYQNTGAYTWKTTNYRSYTRVYVPEGATLLRADGFLETAEPYAPASPDVSGELGKTVIGGFVFVPPGKTHTLTLEYLLPERIPSEFYRLLVQKQPGTIGHALTVDLLFDKKIRAGSPHGSGADVRRRQYRYSGDLSIDRDFEITF